MTVRVRYFAVLRDRRGVASESVATSADTARDLANELTLRHDLDLPASLIRLALNGAFVEDTAPLAEGDELVLMPPVAGG